MDRPNYLPDNFTLSLVLVVTLASVFPASGSVAHLFEVLTSVAIGLLFFLHGAKLTREALMGGIMHWRLHMLVFASTFVLFPVLGLALRPVFEPLVTPALYAGVLFLCMLPATVQSAIALVSIARGNVPAAICSASSSTLIGVFFTPVLVGLLVVSTASGTSSLDSIGRILLQLMLPFLAGHLLRPWIDDWVWRHGSKLKHVDQGSILLVIYTAFSAAVINGLWQQVPVTALLGLLAVCAAMLGLVLATTIWAARRLGFSKADEVAIVFCGSQKSLASGIPMAKILFASGTVGAIVLPLMLFHQMQLMVCAILARRYANRQDMPGLGKALEA
jgi:sodium/bile acid cotransporter 7